MGFIGYPIAVSRRRGLETFHRSGFAWWLVTLGLIVLLTVASHPSTLGARNPASGHLSVAYVVAVGLVGAIACLLAEVAASWIRARRRGALPDRGTSRYEDALPAWARNPPAEVALLVVMAVLEEAVYRGVGLTWLASEVDLDAFWAVLICAVAFGLAHWYYGARQILMKTILGLIFGAVAWTNGWFAAVVAHVFLNLMLVGLGRRANPRRVAV